MRAFRTLAAVAAVTALFQAPACGDGTVVFTIPGGTVLVDAAGDDFNSRYFDILYVEHGVIGTDFVVKIVLDTVPMLPPVGSVPTLPGDIMGTVFLDTDQSSGTGNASSTEIDCPTGQAPIGWDYLIDLTGGRNGSGDYAVQNTSLTTVGASAPVVLGRTIILSTPLSALGGDDGVVDLEAIVGTRITASAPTDCIPGIGRSTLDGTTDTFNANTYDIVQVGTTHTATSMIFNILLTTVPTLPAAGAAPGATDIAGYIDIDVDKNSATGQLPATASQCNGTGLVIIGAEYYVDLTLGRQGDGTYRVFNASTALQTGSATASVAATVLFLTVPLSALGNDDGTASAEMVIGDGNAPTDCLPDLNPLTVVIDVP